MFITFFLSPNLHWFKLLLFSNQQLKPKDSFIFHLLSIMTKKSSQSWYLSSRYLITLLKTSETISWFLQQLLISFLWINYLIYCCSSNSVPSPQKWYLKKVSWNFIVSDANFYLLGWVELIHAIILKKNISKTQRWNNDLLKT